MHILNVINIFLCLYFVNNAYFVRGKQAGLEPPKYFQYITMDFVHRGSFNDTDCLRELLNCWEIVKPDVVCSRGAVYESVCGALRNDCSEKSGHVPRLEFPLFQSFCKPHSYERPT